MIFLEMDGKASNTRFYNIMEYKAKKKYGQNFLVDNKILAFLSSCLDITSNDLIIEIGPGKGALTEILLAKKAQIVCYEIDLDMKPYLDKINNKNLTIKYEDFINSNIVEDLKAFKYQNIFLVANIPYYITTSIIKKIINSKINFKEIYLMVQKEVADRLSASPNNKNYGSLTVYTNIFYECQKIIDVNKRSFNPIPKVDSAIIKLIPKIKEVNNYKELETLLKVSFAHKRKTLKNNLTESLGEIDQILKKHNLSLNNRAEEIPVDVYIEISNVLSKKE